MPEPDCSPAEVRRREAAVAQQAPAKPPIGHGPGTELKKLLASLGIHAEPGCACNAKANEMDEWGIEGCRQRRDEIVAHLRTHAPKWGWLDMAKAAALAVAKGIAFQLDMRDPYGSLVELAIRRAEIATPSHPTAPPNGR